MPRGSGKKREKEYKKLENEFRESERYIGREKEVAARIVNKQRAQFSETRDERRKDKLGESPDRNLPVADYDRLTVKEVANRLDSLSRKEVEQLRAYEQKHKKRKTLLEKLGGKL
jgi:hypothetical protein